MLGYFLKSVLAINEDKEGVGVVGVVRNERQGKGH
jgi:hypothetical protein